MKDIYLYFFVFGSLLNVGMFLVLGVVVFSNWFILCILWGFWISVVGVFWEVVEMNGMLIIVMFFLAMMFLGVVAGLVGVVMVFG